MIEVFLVIVMAAVVYWILLALHVPVILCILAAIVFMLALAPLGRRRL